MNWAKDLIDFLNFISGILFTSITMKKTHKILKKKKKKNNGYTYIIMSHSIFGLISSIFQFIFKFHLIIFEGEIIIIIDFFDETLFNQNVNRFFISFYTFLCYSNIAFPTAIVFASYTIMCRNIPLSKEKTLTIILYVILAGIITCIPVFIMFKNELSSYVWIKYVELRNYQTLLVSKSSRAISCKATSPLVHLLFYSYASYFSINIAMIFCLYYKYLSYMKQWNLIMSNHTRHMYIDFTRLLTFQAFFPVILILIPIIFLYIGVTFGFYQEVEMYGTKVYQLISSISTVNSMLFLILPNKNRREIKIFFKKSYSRIAAII
ncbi:7TM GPCR, serpentine receptor class r (Str) family-containing protein [Strongyloides ratti]|uniref:7TM GPCR, serpentine receptor class r (Str) family-containing protein n=1 Tax=Strongyloides ratti TaxID=34506 RepID=A0A090LR81_STRRB|nr:7TM GPCR, serpentine receptor class r (Str) family-containing protein [Strongyloides ratti]CEF70106.1 7TM GPCR, serpentine receptor class r (Str) family-containing protein [Strongyloides ratti]